MEFEQGPWRPTTANKTILLRKRKLRKNPLSGFLFSDIKLYLWSVNAPVSFNCHLKQASNGIPIKKKTHWCQATLKFLKRMPLKNQWSLNRFLVPEVLSTRNQNIQNFFLSFAHWSVSDQLCLTNILPVPNQNLPFPWNKLIIVCNWRTLHDGVWIVYG